MNNRFLIAAVQVLLMVVTFAGQTRKKVPPPANPVTTQTATTKDGRTVILKSDGTWVYTNDPVIEAKPQPKPTPVYQMEPVAPTLLSIEAAVIYSVGGVQPVARNEFYLLDASVPDILREMGLHAIDRSAEFRRQNPRLAAAPRADTDRNLLEDLVLASRYMLTEEDKTFVSKAALGISRHTVAHGTTDFTGKLTLDKLSTGRYFVYGMTKTRGGYCIWNLAIEIKPGGNSVILDQTNAAIAF